MPPYLQLPMALTERRYRRNRCAPFYRYPVRAASAAPGAACRSPTTAGAVGGVPPNLQPAWRSVSAATPHTLAFAILTAAGTGRRCLPEIAPQGHFLALRAHGATSTFGLLAMTTQGRTGSQPALLRRHKQTLPPGGGRVFSLSKKSLRDFSPSCFQDCKMNFCSTYFAILPLRRVI